MKTTNGTSRNKRAAKRPLLGERLHELRKRHGWTLQAVSDRTGVSVATLSKVERNKMSLTYDKMLQVAEGLHLTLAELVAPPPVKPTARRSIAKPKDGLVQRTPNYEYIYLSPDLSNKRMIPILTRIKTREIEKFGPLVRHSGEEFIFVLEGEILVYTDHYEPTRLKAGEGVYLDSTMGHAFLSVSKKDALVLGICASEDPHHADRLRSIFAKHPRK
ncbi:MAG: helix-turn-helix domain-containing protein [Parvibaculaceae bacterium]